MKSRVCPKMTLSPAPVGLYMVRPGVSYQPPLHPRLRLLRSRRGLRRSNRNRAKKRSRLGNRNIIDLNFRGFEPPGGLIADLFLGKPERTGSMSKAPNKRVLEDGREGTPPRALPGLMDDSAGRISCETTAHTLWRSGASRIGPQHPEQH